MTVTTLCPSATDAAATVQGGGSLVYSILPPGENGLLTAGELPAYEQNGTFPAGSQDQLAPYAALKYGDQQLTDATLGQYFDPETMGIPQHPTRVEHPDPSVAVTIYRDDHDVPHIYGSTLDAMAYGAGYAAAQDRLFLMDVLRHYGEGTLAQFLGPSCAFEQMDHDQLLAAAYTRPELEAQLEALPRRYGALGARVVSMIDSYVAGINRYITETRTDPNLLPADYAAALEPPLAWRPTDVVALASLIGVVATSGGDGVVDAGLLRYLQGQLGASAAPAAFAAFKDQNDPTAPVTIDTPFPYMDQATVDPALTAIPDHPEAPLVGGPTDTTPGCAGSSSGSPSLPAPLTAVAGASSPAPGPALPAPAPGAQNLVSPLPPPSTPGGGGSPAPSANSVAQSVTAVLRARTGMSNAVLIDAAHSSTGHPIAVFGPELGYYAPQILMEEDLHAPGYSAEGAAFPGTNFLVEIGRGTDFAWSATTASAQQTDTRAELICNPQGGPVSPTGTDYLYDGECLPMTEHDYRELAVPKPGGQGAPAVIDHTIFSTRHGIVQGWSTVGGRPVAIVDQRSTYGHEVDSFVGFLRWGMPKLTHDAASWVAGAADITYSFNWFYVDAKHIAYVVSGLDPQRPSNVDPNLPSWGTGGAEWSGYLPAARHPHAVDPSQGYLVSWNNKPAPGFSASNDMFGWGPVFRSQLLTTQLHAQLAAHHQKLDAAEVVQVAEEAATEDLSGTATLRPVTKYLAGSPDPKVQALLSQLEPWLAGGAQRRKPDATAAQYADAAAVAIWDETYPLVVQAVFGPLFAAGGTSDYNNLPYAFDVLPMPFADTPNAQGAHQGDGYYTGWEGYLQSVLAQLEGKNTSDAFPAAVIDRLCGPQGPRSCPGAVEGAFDAAYNALVAANGGDTDPATWTADTATAAASAQQGSTVTMPEYDAIVYEAIGIASPAPQAWQNRPTFQQVVEFGGP